MQILLTGITGFVGQHLSCRLVSEGHNVYGTIRKNKDIGKLSAEVQPVLIDSLTSPLPEAFLNNVDAIVHLAARVHQMKDVNNNDALTLYRQINTKATINLAKQAARIGVRRFIYLSSIKVHGEEQDPSNTPYTEQDICHPKEPYAQSKWEAEQLLNQLAQETSLEIVILRPPLIYGSDVKANFLKLIELIKKGIPLPFGQVENRRSLVYVDNLVDAIIPCLTHPNAKNQTFLISDGQDLSTPDLIRKIAYYLDRPCHLLPVPPSLLKVAGNFADMGEKLLGRSLPLNTPTIDRLLGSLVVDSSKIRNTLNWQPPFTIDEGLQQTLRP
ncbi:UDP-glucose 4-epimerase family protein [Laspinema olomoucense]|uniref:UDP-glucose 4-epimerase family protein n=1 Tax=Laspinema olomoucense TaxID=3231600 RepID=UPI0021BB84CD|nr:SDR family oxidoreductase [Laspinema sp. D3c]MCT7995243.1 SDR family oxidoreductase [Laspinema sp. D3c]